MEVSQYIDNLQLVISGLDNEVMSIARYYQDDILDLIREDQIFNKGILSDNSAIRKYSKDYKGQGRGFPKYRSESFNLFNTGYFYDNFRFNYLKVFKFEVINDTDYVKSLFPNREYNLLIGVSDSNKLYLNNNIIKPKLDEWILKYL